MKNDCIRKMTQVCSTYTEQENVLGWRVIVNFLPRGPCLIAWNDTVYICNNDNYVEERYIKLLNS